MNTKKTTKDIYFAAALLAVGAEYDSVDKTDPKHMEFSFVPRKARMASESVSISTLDLDFVERQWVNKTLTVNAVDYSDAIKRMKSIVHSD